jgi:hypothetical protein
MVAERTGAWMSSPSQPAHLSNHQRSTLRQIFQHPAGHNIEWHAVRSLLEAVGSAEEQHGGKVAVTIVSALSSPVARPASGPVIRGPSGRSSRSCGPAFLLPFGRPASAFLGTLSCQGIQPPLRSAYRTACAYPRLGCGPIAGFPRFARVRPGPGRAPSIPRGQRCSLAIGCSVAAACRLSAAGPCHPGDTAQPGVLT